MIQFFKQLFTESHRDQIPRRAASLAFYALISIAPLLVIVLYLLRLFVTDAKNQILWQINQWASPELEEAIRPLLTQSFSTTAGITATVVSVLILFAAATRVFSEFQLSLNEIWQVKAKDKKSIWVFTQRRLIAVAMLLLFALFIPITLSIQTLTAWLGSQLPGWIPLSSPVWDFIVSVLFLGIVFSGVHQWIPRTKINWKPALVGGFVSAIFFALGKFAFALYLSFGTRISAYGAAGSMVALLIWIYYSTQVIFFGAEITKILTRKKLN